MKSLPNYNVNSWDQGPYLIFLLSLTVPSRVRNAQVAFDKCWLSGLTGEGTSVISSDGLKVEPSHREWWLHWAGKWVGNKAMDPVTSSTVELPVLGFSFPSSSSLGRSTCKSEGARMYVIERLELYDYWTLEQFSHFRLFNHSFVYLWAHALCQVFC